MNVFLKRLYDDSQIPTHADPYDAGWDLYAHLDEEQKILPGETVKIGTGIAVALPTGTFGGVFARSGLATKHGLRPANCTGVIDSSYRGEIIVALHNDSDDAYVVKPGERIAQLVVLPYVPVDFLFVDELDETSRGAGGFGSSGEM